MAFVLTIQGQLMCPHGGPGPAAVLRGTIKHQIGMLNVLCEDNVGSVPFACVAQPPCIAVTSWIPNQIKMRVDGKHVLTDRSVPMTNNGPGRVLSPGQMKLQIG